MNRRGFLKRFAQTVATVAILQGLVPRPKKLEINPDWVDATHEVYFFNDTGGLLLVPKEGATIPIIYKRPIVNA